MLTGIFFSTYLLYANIKTHLFMNENLTNQPEATKKSGKSRRGFASMDKNRHKLVSSKGGKAIRTNYSSSLSATPEASTSPVN
jgi:general stress protein YciG